MQQGPKCQFVRYKGGFATKRSQSASFDFYGPTGRERKGGNVQEYLVFKLFLYSERFTNAISLNKVPFEKH